MKSYIALGVVLAALCGSAHAADCSHGLKEFQESSPGYPDYTVEQLDSKGIGAEIKKLVELHGEEVMAKVYRLNDPDHKWFAVFPNGKPWGSYLAVVDKDNCVVQTWP